jgi:hypothetical protein
VYLDAAYKTTTKQYTMAKTTSQLYSAEDMNIRTDIIKSEITNIDQAERYEVYA